MVQLSFDSSQANISMTAPQDNLQVSVATYTPHVVCDPRAAVPSLSSCRRLTNEIPFGRQLRTFTRHSDDGRRGIQLPRSFHDCEDIAVHDLIQFDKIKG